jgi:RNA polymerase sigma-70 factor (ECF subfamily)
VPRVEHVDRVLVEGAAAHPTVTVPTAAVRALVEQRLQDEDGRTPIDAGELFLACACALGDRTAITAFEQRYFGAIPAALSRLSLGRDEIAEVEQILRVRLFVGARHSTSVTPSNDGTAELDGATEPGEVPRVVAYAGGGQLGGLVRVAAIRAGLNLLRDRGRLATEGADGLDDVPISADDPELAQLKAQHRVAFKAAFERAVAGLEPRERSLLGLAIVRGLGIDRIGAIYGVHRATAARWVTNARTNLTRAVHQILAETLGIRGASAVDDLLPLVESQLELSLERLLRSRPDAEAP